MPVAKKGTAHRLALPILLSGLILLNACGGYTPITGGGAVTIALSADQNSVPPGTSVSINAAVYDQSNQGVTWTIVPLNFGMLSNQKSTNQASSYQTLASVTFTAPANFSAPTAINITATSISNPNVSNSLQLKAVPLSVSLLSPNFLLPLPPQTMNPDEQLPMQAFVANDNSSLGVAWSLSPASGAGSLSSVSPFLATYTAPSTVSSPTSVSLIATSLANSSAFTTLPITLFPSGAGHNVAAIAVDGGPVPNQIHANGAFTKITLCNPGSNSGNPICQTIDGILVDTGSYGLRILQSQISLLNLPTMVGVNGNILQNCATLLDGSYLWGPVSQGDLYMSGDSTSGTSTAKAPGLLIQVISSAAPNNVPTTCSNGGTDRNTPQLLGANGILGIGPEPTDCTLAGKNYCDGSTQPVATNRYFNCPSIGCSTTDTSITVTKLQQVTNPVTGFCPDCNGVILQLPAVSGSESTLMGRLIFGIGTELNNFLGGATVYTLDSEDHFTTVFNGQTLTSSFLDSGSSALLFPSSLPTCSAHAELYCPSTATDLSAINKGATQGQSTVSFTVDNADNLFSEFPDYAAFNNLAGPEETLPTCSTESTSCAFVWGLPFFYGRTVYTSIDGQTVRSAPATPWWAY
jgi:hypothetical protein